MTTPTKRAMYTLLIPDRLIPKSDFLSAIKNPPIAGAIIAGIRGIVFSIA